MSCFIVNPKHIALLAEWAVDRGILTNPYNAKDTLAMANIRSVASRYELTLDQACRDSAGMSMREYLDTVEFLVPGTSKVSNAQIIKALDCLEYQSCECPLWEESAAKYIMDLMRDSIKRYSPEAYEKAAWEVR